MKQRLSRRLRKWGALGLLPWMVLAALGAAENPVGMKKPLPSWVIPTGVFGGLLGASFCLDAQVQTRTKKSARGELGEALGGPKFGRPGGVADFLGRPEFVVASSGLLYLGGSWAGSDRTRRFAVTLTEATLVSGAAALGAKFVFGRSRPTSANDPDTFHLFKGNSKARVSLPSGHATTAFSWAAVTAEEYRSPWVVAAAYVTAGSVCFSRLYQSEHWASDVVAGAGLGYFTGKMVWRREKKKGFLKGLYSDGRGLYWRGEF